jgi:hypothetical protein
MIKPKNIDMMKKIIALAIVAFMAVVSASAQTNLSGRVYHNPNILSGKFKKLKDVASMDIAEARTKAIEKAEKEKGRKLTEAELSKLDKDVKDGLEKAKILSKGFSSSLTVEFKNATDLVMKVDMRIDDAALKAAGISWIKRKALKAALAVAPTSQKGTYIQKGNLVIVTEHGDEETDTLRLSNDGKFLYGKLDEEEFKLTRR